MSSYRVAKIAQLGRSEFCHTRAMTTKTITEYLEDERQKSTDTQRRMDAEAARNQSLHHDHHRTAKQPELELVSPVKTTVKARKTAATDQKSLRDTRKKATKARKVA